MGVRGGMAVGRWRALWVVVVLALVAVACGGDDDGGGSASSSASGGEGGGEPVRGGTLVSLDRSDSPGFDPIIHPTLSTSTGPRMIAVYDALMVENSASGEVAMRIAESLESDDGMNWTLVLRPGVEFSDGTPLDAEAVKFNWERMAAEGLQAPIAQRMVSMEVVDEVTLAIVLDEVDGQFPRTIAGGMLTYIGSPTAIAELGSEGFNTAPIGAGAYMVERWVRDSELVLVRNPNYYGETYLDEIILKPVPDETQRINTLRSGGGDVLWSSDERVAAQARSEDLEVLTFLPGGGDVVLFDTTAAPFDDVRARQAMALAFDSEAMNQALLDGNAQVSRSIMTEDSPFYTPESERPAPDPEEAQRLFDEIAADGEPLSFTIMTIGIWQDRTEWFAAVLEGYDNVEVDIEVFEITDFIPRLNDRTYDMAFFTYLFVDPIYLNEEYGPNASRTQTGWESPALTEALEVGRTSQDDQERIDAYQTVLEELAEGLPVFEYKQIEMNAVHTDEVHGLTNETRFGAPGLPLWNEIWIEQ